MAIRSEDIDQSFPAIGGDVFGSKKAQLSQVNWAGPLSVATPRQWVVPGGDELFRAIYTRARVSTTNTLAVCSAMAGEGKTTVSLGLAVTLAQDFPERRVLLVETDFQKPVLAADFELPANPGLADCLMDGQPIETAYRSTVLENLDLLPAGGPTESPGRLLRSSRMATATDLMRARHDIVILDVPAILVSSDSLLLTGLADGVLLVVRGGVTPSALVSRALAQIDETKLRGVVLNESRSAIPTWLRRLCGF